MTTTLFDEIRAKFQVIQEQGYSLSEAIRAFGMLPCPSPSSPTFALVFHPASEAPSKGRAYESYLLLNPCDGYHIAYPHFDEDGTFMAFRFWASREDIGLDFFVAWAALPDSLSPGLRAFDKREAAPEDANG